MIMRKTLHKIDQALCKVYYHLELDKFLMVQKCSISYCSFWKVMVNCLHPEHEPSTALHRRGEKHCYKEFDIVDGFSSAVRIAPEMFKTGVISIYVCIII